MKFIPRVPTIDAQKIQSITINGDIDADIVFEDQQTLKADSELLAQYTPVAGDYMVTLPDGWKYFVDRAQFEAGFILSSS